MVLLCRKNATIKAHAKLKPGSNTGSDTVTRDPVPSLLRDTPTMISEIIVDICRTCASYNAGLILRTLPIFTGEAKISLAVAGMVKYFFTSRSHGTILIVYARERVIISLRHVSAALVRLVDFGSLLHAKFHPYSCKGGGTGLKTENFTEFRKLEYKCPAGT